MSNLVKYDQARIALAACRNVDEIKDISDKSEAMRLYALQSKLLPSNPGCYIFVKCSEVLYVGESANIKRRIAKHPWRHLLKDGAEIYTIQCKNHKQVEKWLICALSPLLNGKTIERRGIEEAARKKIIDDGLDLQSRINNLSNSFNALFGFSFVIGESK